jgi:GNAT superfamily N-acetyltransferase
MSLPPPSQPTVRIAQPDDAAEVARLNHLFNGCDEPASQYVARLSDPQRVDTPLLAEIDRACVGIANLRLLPQVFYPEPYAELTELFVEEAYRRRGVGRVLLAFAEALAQAAGAAEMMICTGFRNHAAQGLYRACGFKQEDVVLTKPLQSTQTRGN